MRRGRERESEREREREIKSGEGMCLFIYSTLSYLPSTQLLAEVSFHHFMLSKRYNT